MHFLHSAFKLKFAFIIDVLEVSSNDELVALEKFVHLCLSQPYGLVTSANI